MSPLLSIQGITAGYGEISILENVSLELVPGQIYALLGPNGGGKSTTLKVCSGQLVPTKGELMVAGKVMTGSEPNALARAGICTIPEGKGIFPNLTVRENLLMMTSSGATIEEIEQATYNRFPQLSSRRKQLAGTLSGGEQQMLAMSRALSTDPVILLLDELSMGLAPLIVRQLYEIVQQIAEEGVAILVVEQFARTVLEIASTAGIMTHGRLTKEGSPSEIQKDLKHAYLG
ncbi:MAG: ABC transporter ATP-binding protein [Acidimicrobiaceae bacterium]|jgi:branched-chain amino acid transport system ATP-binding protein|nr:ABC transporter ATP-binding protein [Acidimicrobiaceae bacterium]|tara:strand:+ start:1738 stop:2433 length:696 start_codon:yes stop_codon:yes gene_type:complete